MIDPSDASSSSLPLRSTALAFLDLRAGIGARNQETMHRRLSLPFLLPSSWNNDGIPRPQDKVVVSTVLREQRIVLDRDPNLLMLTILIGYLPDHLNGVP